MGMGGGVSGGCGRGLCNCHLCVRVVGVEG